MGDIIAVIEHQDDAGRKEVAFFCPGCERHHFMNIGEGRPRHEWNGDYVKPTFSPSLLSPDGVRRCHAFVKDGKIQFLGDCDHGLAGQTVDLQPHKISNPAVRE